MTEEDAKLLLAVHRTSDPAPPDGPLAEALEMARRDPDLRAWFDSEQDCIKALDAKLEEITPPANLRARILAAGHDGPKSLPRPDRRRVLLAAAAVLVVSLFGSAWWLRRPFASGGTTAAAYMQDMTTYLDRFFLLDFESDKVADATAWLERNHGIRNFTIPKSLAAHPSLGCEVIPWQGRQAYLICFEINGELVHLFLLPGGVDLESIHGDADRYALDPKWTHANWSDGNDLYFFCTLGGRDILEQALDRPLRMPTEKPEVTKTRHPTIPVT